MKKGLFGKNEINRRLWESRLEAVGTLLEGNRRESLGKRTGEKVVLRGGRGHK